MSLLGSVHAKQTTYMKKIKAMLAGTTAQTASGAVHPLLRWVCQASLADGTEVKRGARKAGLALYMLRALREHLAGGTDGTSMCHAVLHSRSYRSG